MFCVTMNMSLNSLALCLLFCRWEPKQYLRGYIKQCLGLRSAAPRPVCLYTCDRLLEFRSVGSGPVRSWETMNVTIVLMSYSLDRKVFLNVFLLICGIHSHLRVCVCIHFHVFGDISLELQGRPTHPVFMWVSPIWTTSISTTEPAPQILIFKIYFRKTMTIWI